MTRKSSHILLFLFFLMYQAGFAQISITLSQNATQLANAMVGPGIVVSNATMNCPPRASGLFNWTGSSVGLTTGIILSTGDADSISSTGGFGLSTSFGAPGDADLNNAIAQPGWPTPIPTSTEDACVLEFDLIPNCDTIAINYIFASAEYNTFVNSNFNDAFAFFISGPGITGTQNIALIPGTNIPITINSVNNGGAGTGPCTNCSYYIDNTTTPPFDPNMEFNGYTRKLTAKQVAVPCATYHIKFVIADGSDDALDSGVFLEQGGFRCLGSQMEVLNSTTGGPGNRDRAVRECIDAVFTFRRTGDSTVPMNVNYQIAGSIVPGVDCATLPGTITIPANQTQIALPVHFFNSTIHNNCLDSILVIVTNSVCGNITHDTAKVYVLCAPEINLPPDTTLCPGASMNIGYPAEARHSYNWTPAVNLNSAFVSNPRFSSLVPGIFPIENTKTDSLGCSAKDTITITVISLPGNSFSLQDTGCLYEDITITYDSTQVPGDLYFWDFFGGQWRGGLDGGPLQVGWFNTGPKLVSLVINRGGCLTDTFKRIVDILPLPINGFTANTPICWNKEDTLIFTGTTLPGTRFHWDIDSGIYTSIMTGYDDTVVTNMWNAGGTYTVSLWLDQHSCISDTLYFDVLQYPSMEGFIEDDTLICWGDTNYIDLGISGGDGGPYNYNWFPDRSINNQNVPIPTVYPEITTQYTVYVSDACGQELNFSSTVNVRALPPAPQVTDDTICAGEQAMLKGLAMKDSLFVHWYNAATRSQQYYPIFTGEYFKTPALDQTTIYFTDTEDPFRCRSRRVPAFVYVNPVPKVLFEAYPKEMELPTAISSLEPEVNSFTGIVSYLWDFGDGNFSNDRFPSHQYFLEGEYDISLTVVDSNSCVGKLSKNQYIKVTKPLILNVPNAFTPNGDGVNDYFKVGTVFLKDLQIVIFDRWGNQVFESFNPDFRWDGTMGGTPLPEGVYVYNITGHDHENVPIARKGSITLLR